MKVDGIEEKEERRRKKKLATKKNNKTQNHFKMQSLQCRSPCQKEKPSHFFYFLTHLHIPSAALLARFTISG